MRARWSIGLTLGALLWSLPARALDVPVSEQARAHFNAGVNLLQDPDGARYEEAYREFRAAYAASPSWKILGNLGIAAMKLERDGEAVEAFSRYLAEGGRQLDPEERAQTERDLQTLKTGLVRLVFAANQSGARLIDERALTTGTSVVNRYGPMATSLELGVRPGHHRVTITLAGFKDILIELDAEPQQTLNYRLEFKPLEEGARSPGPSTPPLDVAGSTTLPAQDKRPLFRTLSYAAFGVGALGLGAGTWLALSAKSKFDEANEMCPAFPCSLTASERDRRSDLGDAGEQRKTLSMVGFVAGGLGIAAGATLLVLSATRRENTASRPPEFWLSSGGIGMRGQF